MMRIPRLALIVAAMVLAVPAAAGEFDGVRLKSVLAGDHREAKNSVRDQFRHPFETLKFFGLTPDMTVVEIFPGGGWYTEILAPYLKDSGRYYAASWDKSSKSKNIQKWLKRYHAKLAARPDLYSGVIVTELSRTKTAIAPPGGADMVLTFRNVHNWMKRGYEAIIFDAMYRTLKPGGILGLVEHRGNPEVWQDPQALNGYVNEETAIELAENAGFRLLGKSGVNANPKDAKDYPKGVWTLPPSLRMKDKDREKYLAIGESDRMTLKFIKPTKEEK